MNIVPQVLLSSSVLILGILFILPIFPSNNSLLLISTAWFTGWGMCASVAILSVIIGMYVDLVRGALVVASAILCNWFYFRENFKKRDLGNPHVVLGILVLCIFGFYILSKYAAFIHYSTDSITNEGLSRVFHFYGIFADGRSSLYYWLFNVRLPFYIAIHNIAYLSEIKIFYSFLSESTIMLTLMMVGFVVECKEEINFSSFIALLICGGLFITNKLVIFHSFYSLSNLTNMIYYSSGIFFLNRYRKTSEVFWFLIACFFLGITCIIRKEMLIFSLLPFWWFFREIDSDWNMVLKGMALYILTGYTWYFWGMFGLREGALLIGSPIQLVGHGGNAIIAGCFLLSILSFLIFPIMFNTKHTKIKYILPVVAVAAIFAGLFMFGEKGPLSFYRLLLLMFTNRGQWGLFWWVFVFFSVFLLLPLFGNKKENTVFEGDWFLPGIIFGFFALRVLLYAAFPSPADTKWNTSGNRVLLHILPVCVYWMGQVSINRFALKVHKK